MYSCYLIKIFFKWNLFDYTVQDSTKLINELCLTHPDLRSWSWISLTEWVWTKCHQPLAPLGWRARPSRRNRRRRRPRWRPRSTGRSRRRCQIVWPRGRVHRNRIGSCQETLPTSFECGEPWWPDQNRTDQRNKSLERFWDLFDQRLGF